jgi:hypothetical protein
MNISIDNRRITVTDNTFLALTPGQKALFSHWEEGFDAQGRGVRFENCPHVQRGKHKVRNVWREGWLAGAAVDRIKLGPFLTRKFNAIQNY